MRLAEVSRLSVLTGVVALLFTFLTFATRFVYPDPEPPGKWIVADYDVEGGVMYAEGDIRTGMAHDIENHISERPRNLVPINTILFNSLGGTNTGSGSINQVLQKHPDVSVQLTSKPNPLATLRGVRMSWAKIKLIANDKGVSSCANHQTPPQCANKRPRPICNKE